MAILITKVNELYYKVDSESISILEKIVDHFKYFVPHAFYNAQYKMGLWDGYIRLYNPLNRLLPSGLLPDLKKFLDELKVDYTDIQEEIVPMHMDTIKKFPSMTNKSLTGRYEYQHTAILKAIEHNKIIIKSPTACLDPNTLIETPDGFQSLQSIHETVQYSKIKRCEIPTVFGFSQVIDTYIKTSEGVFIQFDDETSIKCSIDHEMLHDGYFKQAKYLHVGDSFETKKIVNIEHVPVQNWIDLSIKDDHESYICNDIVHHNSGKSSIIYLLIRYYLETQDKDILIIVPSVALTEQMKTDFISYVDDGFDIENETACVHGKSKEVGKKRVVIAFYRAVCNKPQTYFDRFGVFICDEVHTTGKSITTIINKLPNVKFRIGLTGTLKDTKSHTMTLKGFFGEIYEATTIKESIDTGVASPVNIQMHILNYDEDTREDFWNMYGHTLNYQKETEWLCGNEKRTRYIAETALGLEGNTLILFYRVPHGRLIYQQIMETDTKNSKLLFFINGDTEVEEREIVREKAEINNNVIIVASSSIFSTGINIKNLHNVIFTQSYRAKIRTLQSVGRVLRLHENKEQALLIDVCDKLNLRNKSNISINQAMERFKMYKKEKFPVSIVEKRLE
jgi:superfamily II DNA or RNA helicase